ncbi:DUF7676 family protein [Beijerinckia mobilis]|uniref:DUF7676 family protein n=1 Tax=Beijerinckia mobilis TaxID=231434 RepID=UPI000553397D|nr:hypothetical protein [Beijerinckia mobilis]
MTIDTSVETVPQRRVSSDGVEMDIFPLPTDCASLDTLLRDLFTHHWQEIIFGPIIQGAAFEIHAEQPPTSISLFDGYLTVAFGHTHFHICIGDNKGSRSQPTGPELARHRRTSRAELYRRINGGCVPMSWGIQFFNGADEQQLTILLPNPFLDPQTEKVVARPDWSRLALWDSLRARWLGLTRPDPTDRSMAR